MRRHQLVAYKIKVMEFCSYLTVCITIIFGGMLRADDPAFFSREVLPILSENCFSCHGPDEANRKADLRVDSRDGALQALVPGNAEASELIARILSDEDDLVMPPPSSHKPRLKPDEVATLKAWIQSGATWGKHWSYAKPTRSSEPIVIDQQLAAKAPAHFPLRSPIDQFVWARLNKVGLAPSFEAELHTLLRRVSFDLTGLPPTIEELRNFDGSASSYETAVDRLLASPHFGERMAMWWLDVSRYADTDGFQSDSNRENWPWRDWVVEVFNSNM